MHKNIEEYIHRVLDCMVADEQMKERVRKDLYSHLAGNYENDSMEVIIEKMGSPEEVAREFMDSIYEDKEQVIERLIKERNEFKEVSKEYYEYKSKKMLFGLPLVHINTRSWVSGYRRAVLSSPRVAKGIIAIGEVAIGVVSLGAIAIGGLCLGGLSIGLLALGGLTLGLFSLGGVAIGLVAGGGVAIGALALGGVAIGNIAIGGYAQGIVAIGDEVHGQYVLQKDTHEISAQTVSTMIKTAYPGLGDWIVRVISSMFLK